MKKELKELVKKAGEQGWRVEMRSSGHLMFFPPDKSLSPITSGGTPSDHRALKNLKAMLKRSGLRFDGIGFAGIQQVHLPYIRIDDPDAHWALMTGDDSPRVPWASLFAVYLYPHEPGLLLLNMLVSDQSDGGVFSGFLQTRYLADVLSREGRPVLDEMTGSYDAMGQTSWENVSFRFSKQAKKALSVWLDLLMEQGF